MSPGAGEERESEGDDRRGRGRGRWREGEERKRKGETRGREEAEKIGKKLYKEIDIRLVLSQWGPELENRHPDSRVAIEPYGQPSVEAFINEEEG